MNKPQKFQIKICFSENDIYEWLDEIKETVRFTYNLLDELEKLGWPYKRLKELRLVRRDTPVWVGLNKTEGCIEIDPAHDARAVAHELGHGFEEKCREKWKVAKNEKRDEAIAEAVRHFVEEKMGSKTWKCPEEYKLILEKCNCNFVTFKEIFNQSSEEFRDAYS